MKTSAILDTIKDAAKSLVTTVILCGLLLALAAPRVEAVQFLITPLTLFTNSVTTASVSNTTSTPYFLPVPGAPVAFLISGKAINNGTSNVISGFDYSIDGTNYTTTIPLTFTNTAAGSNNTFSQWFILTNTAGIQSIRYDYLSSAQTNNVTNITVTAMQEQ